MDQGSAAAACWGHPSKPHSKPPWLTHPAVTRSPAVCLLGFGWSEKALTEYSSGGLWADQLGDFIKEIVQRRGGGANADAGAGAQEGGAPGSEAPGADASGPPTTEPVVLAGNSLVRGGGRGQPPAGGACAWAPHWSPVAACGPSSGALAP
jgi:hypothetical protein